jgi:hypothetical protein
MNAPRYATDLEYAQEYDRLAGLDDSWGYATHDYDALSDNGRYYSPNSHGEIADTKVIAQRIVDLCDSPDPRARLHANHLASLLHFGITLPPGTWCVVDDRGSPDHPSGPSAPNYSHFPPRDWITTAHYTKENAEAWLPVIAAAFPESRYRFVIKQMDNAHTWQLCRLEAEPRWSRGR